MRRALGMNPTDIADEMIASGLRCRGGAGFPAGLKWQTVQRAEAPKKYV